jgi:hypothetical protein
VVQGPDLVCVLGFFLYLLPPEQVVPAGEPLR